MKRLSWLAIAIFVAQSVLLVAHQSRHSVPSVAVQASVDSECAVCQVGSTAPTFRWDAPDFVQFVQVERLVWLPVANVSVFDAPSFFSARAPPASV